MAERTIFGVDFSGAAEAGKKIWVAWAILQNDVVVIEDCQRASALPSGGVQRDDAYAALRQLVIEEPDGVFGLDFPFSLAAEMIPYPDWETFATRFGDDYPTPQHFYSQWRGIPACDGRALKRETDRETKTPFAPQNLRIHRQTYYGIRDLLAPLVTAGAAVVPPLQTPREGIAWLLEICPASLLKARRRYWPYKGDDERARAGRERLLTTLDEFGVVLPQPLRAVLIDDDEGDALDAVLAANATGEALRCEQPFTTDDPVKRIEGVVYGALPGC